jgi:DNA-binding response OmpR family regulator
LVLIFMVRRKASTWSRVDVHMCRLRHKADGPGETPMIYNIRGAGFTLREAGRNQDRSFNAIHLTG